MFDLIAVGDSTIDNFVQIHDAEVKCNLNKTDCKLCVEYGDKIPVDKLSHEVAGNAANCAVGASRLELKTAVYTNIGSDPAGRQIFEKLEKEGIDERYIILNQNMESNLSTVLTFKGERTIFVYHQKWDYKLPDLDLTKWVYFTSVGESFTQTNLIPALTVFLERTGAKLFYNPGTYQLKAGIKKDHRLLALTGVFIVNQDEAEKILGKNESVKKLLKGLVALGPKMVVITRGQSGSYGFDGEKFYQIGIFPAKLAEATGAGDAYATGVLAGLFYGEDLKEAMRWGAANGASVVEQIGPQAGLLTLEQMQKKLAENSKIIAKEV